MRTILIIAVVLALIGAVFGIFWSAGQDFGMRQAIEFFPYYDEIILDSGETIHATGVVIRVNTRDAAPTDQAMATLMESAKEMYPDVCQGANWEISVRRPSVNEAGIESGEENYSYSFSVYETFPPASWIEYGYWTDNHYVVIDSYPADWPEIIEIAQGRTEFQIKVQ